MKTIKTTSLIAIAIFVPPVVCKAQTPTSRLSSSQARDLSNLAPQLKAQIVMGWENMPWTEDNKPFFQIRQEVDQAIKEGQNPLTLEKKHRVPVKSYYNSRAQFRWAYITYRVVLKSPDSSSLGISAITAMDRTLWPNTYEWTRLRFLLDRKCRFTVLNYLRKEQGQFINAGERLLKREPNDREVLWEMRKILGYTAKVEDRQRGLKIAQRLLQLDPNNARYIAGVAGSNMDIWSLNNNRGNLKAAITGYERYLKIAPKTDPFRNNASRLLKHLRSQ
jgi:hypothetical protein